MIVADAKDSGRDLPNWLEPDRAQAVAVLKVMMIFMHLKLLCQLQTKHDKELWLIDPLLDSDTNSNSDLKPNGYIVISRTFHTAWSHF